jgi:hypothetical protein
MVLPFCVLERNYTGSSCDMMCWVGLCLVAQHKSGCSR